MKTAPLFCLHLHPRIQWTRARFFFLENELKVKRSAYECFWVNDTSSKSSWVSQEVRINGL